jgi:eukaryotic-like serine/threonine-protein kinase
VASTRQRSPAHGNRGRESRHGAQRQSTGTGLVATGRRVRRAVVVDGEIIIGVGSDVRAFSATDGHQLWSFDTGNDVQDTPAVADGLVFVGSDTGRLYALDLQHGRVRWIYRAISSLRISPAVADGVVIVPVSDEGLFVALRSLDGAVLWTKHFVGGSTAMTPTIAGAAVYVADAEGGHLAALSLQDGSTIWQIDVAEGIADPVPIADGVLYPRTLQGTLMAVRASDGITLWSTPIGSEGLGPAVHGNRVFVGLVDGMAAYDTATGTQVWKFPTPVRAGSATVAGGIVYFMTIDATVFGVDEKTGTKLWKASDAGQPREPPTVVDGTVYVNGQSLVAYRPTSIPTSTH